MLQHQVPKVRELLKAVNSMQAPSKNPKGGSSKKQKTSVETDVVEERREVSRTSSHIKELELEIKELEKELQDAPSAETHSS